MASTSIHLTKPPIPKIYAWTATSVENIPWGNGEGVGLLKVGYTSRDDAGTRIHEQTRTVIAALGEVKTVLVEIADGQFGYFTDHHVHAELRRMGRRQVQNEWFEATVDDVHNAINAIRAGTHHAPTRTQSFPMRPEQEAAVLATADYFNKCRLQFEQGSKASKRAPHYLWNAKMRFGKTFTTYQLAKTMGWKRILVLTFKPAVQSAWQDDLAFHRDFEGWQFIGKDDTWDDCVRSPEQPVVWFASFQDVLGRDDEGAIKGRLLKMWEEEWDCVVLDEYHFGSWRDRAKELYDSEGKDEVEGGEFDEEVFPLTAKHFLYLSGTPFRSLAMGEFTEDQIYSWTYSDEQRAKKSWDESKGPNPYAELPQMVMLTYQLPDDIRSVAQESDVDEFDLNEFFAATKTTAPGKPTHYEFKHPNEVQRWLDVLRGHVKAYDGSLAGTDVVQPPVPFEDVALRMTLRHTFWFLPSVASCFAMAELLSEPANSFYDDYKVVVSAGTQAGIGMAALPPVEAVMGSQPTKTKSITLSCGKLTTGVTVPPWSGIMMLKNTTSPETYFQAAFRVQSPWKMAGLPDPVNGGEVPLILKPTCYVFDFAPQRALRLLSEYATQVASDPNATMEQKVAEFLYFLPVLCFEGSSMEQLDAGPLLDFVATGTASTMLARQWQSARLIDMSKDTFERLLAHPDVIAALTKLESFRNLRDLNDKLIATINNEAAINKTKAKGDAATEEESDISGKLERENKSFRKELAENLKKLAARIPVFMYLTDEREETVKDVINSQGDLFERATGLTQADFKALCDIGVFNKATMDSAVFNFRRFELASLNYLGGGKEQPLVYGGMMDAYASGDDVRDGNV